MSYFCFDAAYATWDSSGTSIETKNIGYRPKRKIKGMFRLYAKLWEFIK